jgi:hypothetical protein
MPSSVDIEPLDPQTHAELGLRRDLDYGFARPLSVAPLHLSEFAAASVWYPIVFTHDGLQPAAVMGLAPGPNLFVRDDGAWRLNAYVPAVFRRYPFVLEKSPEGAYRLGVVNAREVLAKGGRPLYAKGAPTALHRNAVELCRNLLADEAKTATFVRALRELELLAPRVATVAADTERAVKQGYQTIDERRLRGLGDEAFLMLRREGWLGAIFAQLNSILNWHKIGDLHARAEAKVAPERRAKSA